jgi:hypothetical protein
MGGKKAENATRRKNVPVGELSFFCIRVAYFIWNMGGVKRETDISPEGLRLLKSRFWNKFRERAKTHPKWRRYITPSRVYHSVDSIDVCRNELDVRMTN